MATDELTVEDRLAAVEEELAQLRAFFALLGGLLEESFSPRA